MILEVSLKKIREFRGITQKYMAARLDISQPTYSELERDKFRTNIEKYDIISKELGISLEQAMRHKVKIFIYVYNDNYPPIEKINIEKALIILSEQNEIIKKMHQNLFKNNKYKI